MTLRKASLTIVRVGYHELLFALHIVVIHVLDGPLVDEGGLLIEELDLVVASEKDALREALLFLLDVF